MKKNCYNVKNYIEYMINHGYHILLIIDDLVIWFGFRECCDNVIRDIRTIMLENIKTNESVIIKSSTNSYFYEKFTQFNEINYIDMVGNNFNYKYIGKCYKTKNII